MPLTAALIAAAVVAGIAASLAALSFASRRGGPPGLIEGQLAPCPPRPNAVSSETDSAARQIEPLTFEGPPEAAWEALGQAIRGARGTIRKDHNGYLWATFASRLWRFVDDVEFRLDGNRGLIHVRSASRVGYADFGANRRRVENLRREFRRMLS